ncbi:hypothetical protein [Agrobacterium radiobacter]|uniref:hypothetical protein n=1 Tax=Agrobacterium radiobacter TaxID=362 RepID=UPI003CE56814
MVVEQRALLTARCRVQIIAAGATIVRPVSSVSQVLQTLEAGEVDAAILDAELMKKP